MNSGENQLSGLVPSETRVSPQVVRFGLSDAAALPTAMDITHRIRAVLDLLPKPRVVAVYVDIRGGLVTDGERLVVAQLFDQSAGLLLNEFLVAENAVSTTGSPGWWEAEWAVRAAESMDFLGRDLVDAAPSGLAVDAAGAQLSAALSLRDLIPPLARRVGGNSLRVSMGTLRAGLGPGMGAASEILNQMWAEWPVADDDLPDLDDTAMSEFNAQVPRRPVLVFAGGDFSEVASDVDIQDLIDAGLVAPNATAMAGRVGSSDVPAWKLRIPLRPDVAAALKDLWEKWGRFRSGDRSGDDLLVSYARLTALTALPFSIDALLKASRQAGAPSPHLVDVRCTVSHGEHSASLTFLETESADGVLDLVVTLPLRAAPSRTNTVVEIVGGRQSAIVEPGASPVQDLLELRALWKQETLTAELKRRARDLYRRLTEKLDGEAAAALAVERSAWEQGDIGIGQSRVHDTVSQMVGVEHALARELQQEVKRVVTRTDPAAIEELRVAVASLWRVRLFLRGTPAD